MDVMDARERTNMGRQMGNRFLVYRFERDERALMFRIPCAAHKDV